MGFFTWKKEWVRSILCKHTVLGKYQELSMFDLVQWILTVLAVQCPGLSMFLFLWWHWVFVAACRPSLAAVIRGYSSLWYTGSSLQWLLLCRGMGSRVQAQ